ncbi:MAG: zinc protease [Candidatus Dependentiae bacterium]|nr:zinc protease [Candidatus Dependentiae bacterium]
MSISAAILANQGAGAQVTIADRQIRHEIVTSLKSRIHQFTLENGMTILCIPATNTNIVTVGAFVRAGGACEAADEQGLAHILEHMIFKGTRRYREGDIDLLAKNFGMQAGQSYNAYTTYENTYYYFETDDKNWTVFADVIADATQNLVVAADPLNSELCVIAQEIKERSEDIDTLSMSDLLPMNHPYAHRLIGYKEQVLGYSAEQVMAFYEKHYTPKNTTFFVCGNVDPNAVVAYAQQAFVGFTRADRQPAKVDGVGYPFYAGFSTVSKTLYHTQQHRVGVFLWQLPGSRDSASLAFDYITTALQSRLKDKLINRLGYCFNVGCGASFLEHGGLFAIQYIPRPEFYAIDYEALVIDELSDIAAHGLSEAEFAATYHDKTFGLVRCAEDPSTLVAMLAVTPLSGQNIVTQFFQREDAAQAVTQEEIQAVAVNYLRSFRMNKLIIEPLPVEEYATWNALQIKVSAHDMALLQARKRANAPMTGVQNDTSWLPPRLPLDPIAVGDHETFELSNGMKVYWQRNTASPCRVCGLVLRDAEELSLALGTDGKIFAKQVLPHLLLQGTDSYSAKEFADLLHSQGIGLTVGEEFVQTSALKNNFEEALRLMRLAIDKPMLSMSLLERKKQEYIQQIDFSQNDPGYRLNEYLQKTLYAKYPWKFGQDQTIENMQTVTIDDVKKVLSLLRDPARVALVLCGDFDQQEVQALAENYFGSLCEAAMMDSASVAIPDITEVAVVDHIELSIDQSYIFAIRKTCTGNASDAAILALLSNYIQKQVLDIRERSGFFYAGDGGVIRGSTLLPGTIRLTVAATPDNVDIIIQELVLILQKLYIEGLSATMIQSLKDERAHARSTYCITADKVAGMFMNALYSGLPLNDAELFDKEVDRVTVDQVNQALRKYFDPASWSFITVGRSPN